MEKSYMATIVFFVVITILLLFFKNDNNLDHTIRKYYFRHTVFFVLCYCIVFFQCDLDFIFGLLNGDENIVWINPKIVCKSMAISNIALVSLCLGISFFRINKIGYSGVQAINITHTNKKALLLIVSVLLIIYYLVIPKDYLDNGYERGVSAGSAILVIRYLQAGFIALFTIYCIEYRIKKSKDWLSFFKYPLTIIIIYMLLILVTGRRTEAIRAASLILISFLYCKQNYINYKKLLVFCFSALFVFSLIGVLRTMNNGSVDDSIELLNESRSISPLTREYAGSVNTLHIAVDSYPKTYEFNYGETFFPSFFKIIPGLSSFYEQFIVGSKVPTSAEIFTDIYFGGNKIWGLGSSVNADIYISFGTIGICIIYILFGWFLRILEYKTFIHSNSPYWLALSFSAYSAFLFVCRSNLATIFLCWTYACILIFLFSRPIFKRQKRNI